MSTVNTRSHHSKTPRRKSAAHGGPTPAREPSPRSATQSRRRADADQGRQLTIDDVAGRLGTTERYVRRLIEERRITYVKLGPGKRSPVRIPEPVLNAFIAEHTVEADS